MNVGNWKFNQKKSSSFESHIKKSVPDYLYTHGLIIKLIDFFTFPKSTIIDIGATTGNLIKKIHKRHSQKNLSFIAIEPEKKMVRFLKKNLRNIKNVKILNNNAENTNIIKSDMIISHYTIQFIKPSKRQGLIKKIYKSLNKYGCFIWFEKIKGKNSKFEFILSSLLNDHKEINLSAKNIIAKAKSIRGIMEPLEDSENLKMLKKAGFNSSKIQTIHQNLNFKGYLCLK
ncbi:methyltransferase [Candidatus Pelagibacter ubique]|nr:methyltransferase [Candidatus Pelagibacter ubique]